MESTHFLVYVLCVLCSYMPLSYCHICLITPRQRGDMDISHGGSSTCFHHGEPCGNIPPEVPAKITLEGGVPIFVKWQQNFNHYSVGYPGYMDISYAVANIHDVNGTIIEMAPDPFMVLAVVPDMDEYDQAHQRNYTAVVTLPKMECDHCVIRARYVAHKPGETTFYQCADVRVTLPKSGQNRQTSGRLQLLNDDVEKEESLTVSLRNKPGAQNEISDQLKSLKSLLQNEPKSQVETENNIEELESSDKIHDQRSLKLSRESKPQALSKLNAKTQLKAKKLKSFFKRKLNLSKARHWKFGYKKAAYYRKKMLYQNRLQRLPRILHENDLNQHRHSKKFSHEARSEDESKPGEKRIKRALRLTQSSFTLRRKQPEIQVPRTMSKDSREIGNPVTNLPNQSKFQTETYMEEANRTMFTPPNKFENAESDIQQPSTDELEREEFVTKFSKGSYIKHEQFGTKLRSENEFQSEEFVTEISYKNPDRKEIQTPPQLPSESAPKIFGMTNQVDSPSGAVYYSIDVTTGERQQVAVLDFHVDSPYDPHNIMAAAPNGTISFVTDGVITVDGARGISLLQLNSYNSMDHIADRIIQVNVFNGKTETVVPVAPINATKLSSAFSAMVVEIEDSYVTFNIEPTGTDGTYSFVLGRLLRNGQWQELGRCTEDLYVNFQWADYDIAVKTLYVLMGNENDPYNLTARLYKFFVPPGPPVYPIPDVAFVDLDVSKFTFMSFHIDTNKAETLMAISPGRHDTEYPPYHLVSIDVDLGTVTDLGQITPPGIFERYYGGTIFNAVDDLKHQLLHVLRVGDSQTDVIVSVDTWTFNVTFSQLTNLRHMHNLVYAWDVDKIN